MKEIADLEEDEGEGRLDVETEMALTVNREEEKMFINISSLAASPSKADDEWFRFYTFTEDESDSSRCPKLRPGFHSQLQSLLRGHRAGVLKNVDPLLPIDFELEVDGIAGIFPGNSFHSSYLPERYRNESIFQAVGVSHKIDSSGWFTTIKGQIRATSIAVKIQEKSDEQKAQEAEDKRIENEKKEQEEADRIKRDAFNRQRRLAKIPDLAKATELGVEVSDEDLLMGNWKIGGKKGVMLTDKKLISRRGALIMGKMRGMILEDGRMDVNSEAFKGALNFISSLPAPMHSSLNHVDYPKYITTMHDKYKRDGG
jgi:hypothetical protein